MIKSARGTLAIVLGLALAMSSAIFAAAGYDDFVSTDVEVYSISKDLSECCVLEAGAAQILCC